jgi:hypothetical protein
VEIYSGICNCQPGGAEESCKRKICDTFEAANSSDGDDEIQVGST